MREKTTIGKTRIQSYTVVFEPMPEGGYNVVVPAIPEVCTFGRTIAEAKRMATDALRCYLESVAKERGPLPAELRRIPVVRRVAIKVQVA